jgi:hypothetical protein
MSNNAKPQMYKGEPFPSIKALAAHCNVSAVKLGQLLKNGYSPEQAIDELQNPSETQPYRRPRKREPLYVTDEGRQIWDYNHLADYFGVSRREMQDVRLRFHDVDKVIEHFNKKRATQLNHIRRNEIVADVGEFIFHSLHVYPDSVAGIDYVKRGGFTSYHYVTLPRAMNEELSEITNIPKFVLHLSGALSMDITRILKTGYVAKFSATMHWLNNSDCEILYILTVAKKDSADEKDINSKITKTSSSDSVMEQYGNTKSNFNMSAGTGFTTYADDWDA